jgi:hypothetical protein
MPQTQQHTRGLPELCALICRQHRREFVYLYYTIIQYSTEDLVKIQEISYRFWKFLQLVTVAVYRACTLVSAGLKELAPPVMLITPGEWVVRGIYQNISVRYVQILLK